MPSSREPTGRLYDLGKTLGALALFACVLKAVILIAKEQFSVGQALMCLLWGGATYGMGTAFFVFIAWMLSNRPMPIIVQVLWWVALLLSYVALWIIWDCLG